MEQAAKHAGSGTESCHVPALPPLPFCMTSNACHLPDPFKLNLTAQPKSITALHAGNICQPLASSPVLQETLDQHTPEELQQGVWQLPVTWHLHTSPSRNCSMHKSRQWGRTCCLLLSPCSLLKLPSALLLLLYLLHIDLILLAYLALLL